MGKSLYSLILDDGVVAEIDAAAEQRRVSRSALINEILAEYCSYVTPEQQTRSLFKELSELLLGLSFQMLPASNSKSIAMKTNLDCKYKPTIKYEFEFKGSGSGTDCNLKAVWRTTDAELQRRIEEFLNFWVAAENKFGVCSENVEYSIENGKIQRACHIDAAVNVRELKNAVVQFIRFFNEAIKRFTTGEICDYTAVERFYGMYLSATDKYI